MILCLIAFLISANKYDNTEIKHIFFININIKELERTGGTVIRVITNLPNYNIGKPIWIKDPDSEEIIIDQNRYIT